ncbi:iron-containing redox enzyme family protein [Streptomyces sp. ISL-111]|uniref:iron-containing redox enzyme family protein n=1 Tax=unclassified Streptomyces TaxID=2593676 RepID=UPI001BE98974|nr:MULTISPECIES: iron-containing redox enzyme family protein [unclassified Streptomyces]MBT2377326.1 iron-containing redox enzyme family protein [Streptomyces sp. ISL-111]MBT2425491.1 iron-containing redox enzyme family protein [Streptomyces sp. ISL-112]MBT2465695.1 iron-containing redox enzyme family protein [Streptomyces sp. ISL-63]
MSITWTSAAAPRRASTRLRTKLLLLEPEFRDSTTHMWRPEGLLPRYRSYLCTMHAVIRASVPLMELALRRTAVRPGDPLSEPLAAYLAEHIQEEAGHDTWLLEDLLAAGAAPEDALGPLPPPDVATLVGPPYYWIEHHHPVALLGYIAVLEGYAPAPGLTDRVGRLTGLPAAALRTVREHAALDTHHLDELYALLDRLPLTRDQEAAVAVSALHSLDALTRLFVRLGRSAPAPSLRGAGPTPPTGVTR